MRVQLEVGGKNIDLENRLYVYKTDSEDDLFLGLVRDALVAMGYSEADLLDAWNKKVGE